MRRLVIVSFLLLTAFCLFVLCTPLRFESWSLRNIIFLITLALCFPAAYYIKNKILRGVVKLMPIAVLLIAFFAYLAWWEFNSRIGEGWQTVWINYRKTNHPNTYIGQQMLDVGAAGYRRRIVKVISITPLFNWTVLADTTKLDGSWYRVRESYNPFNWKGG